MSKLKVVAKFKCNSITENEYNKQAQLSAVYGTKGENADFTKATPWGEVKINIDKNVPASDYFKPGKEYYLTFEEVPEPAIECASEPVQESKDYPAEEDGKAVKPD